MEWANLMLARLRALWRREAILGEIDDELRSHFEMEVQAGVALLACYLPARRAALVDPMIALRCD